MGKTMGLRSVLAALLWVGSAGNAMAVNQLIIEPELIKREFKPLERVRLYVRFTNMAGLWVRLFRQKLVWRVAQVVGGRFSRSGEVWLDYFGVLSCHDTFTLTPNSELIQRLVTPANPHCAVSPIELTGLTVGQYEYELKVMEQEDTVPDVSEDTISTLYFEVSPEGSTGG